MRNAITEAVGTNGTLSLSTLLPHLFVRGPRGQQSMLPDSATMLHGNAEALSLCSIDDLLLRRHVGHTRSIEPTLASSTPSQLSPRLVTDLAMPPRGRQPQSKGAAPTKVRPDHRASSRGPTGRSPADVQLRPRSVLNRAVPPPRPLSGPVTVSAPAPAPPPSSSSSSSPRPRSISPPLAHGPTTSSGSRDEPDRNDFSFPPNPNVFVSINPPENPSDSLEPGDPSEERPRRPREVEDVLVKPGRRVREIAGQETKKGRQIRRSGSRPRGPGLLMMLARINRTLEPVCARIARVAQPVVVAPILLYVLTWLWLLAQEMSIFGVGPTVERIGAAVCETGMRELLPTTSCDPFQARPMMLPGLNTTDAFGAASRKELLMSFASLELDSAVLGSMKQDVEGLTGAAAARLNLALATFDASRSLAHEGLRAWLRSPPSRELTRLWKGWAARSVRAGEQGRRAAAGLHYVFPPRPLRGSERIHAAADLTGARAGGEGVCRAAGDEVTERDRGC